MKALARILALLACAIQARAQGTLQFNATLTGTSEVPPNTDSTVGSGKFSLTGNVLSFYVSIPAVTFITTGGSISGPAMEGSNAPALFDLGGFAFHPGSGFGDPPSYYSESPASGPFGAGPFTLTDTQVSDLENGLWYVNITSAQQPAGQLRGKILQVPEPSVLGLLSVGAAACIALASKRCRRLPAKGRTLFGGRAFSWIGGLF